jgi:hypothetical protein
MKKFSRTQPCFLANARRHQKGFAEFLMLRMPWSVQFTSKIYLVITLTPLVSSQRSLLSLKGWSSCGTYIPRSSGSKQLLRAFEMMDGVRLGGNQVSNSNDSAQPAYRVLGCFAVQIPTDLS